MKKLPQHLEEKLLEYADGTLSGVDRKKFEDLLEQDGLLRERLQRLQNADLMLKEVRLDHPSKNFTEAVLRRLDQKPVRAGLSLRNGIFLFSGILIVTSLAVILLSAGVFDQSTTFDLNRIGIVQHYIKQSLPQISIDGKMIVNVIILLNLVLAFMVLDRAILKPFFQRRMETGH